MPRKERPVGTINVSPGCIQRTWLPAAAGLDPQYRVSLTLTRRIAGALLQKIVAMQPENWSSAPHQLTMGPPQGSALSSVLFSVFTKGLAELNQSGPSTILTLADEGFI